VIYKSKDDGITHINIYSKGKTELGRWLSNFTYHPIETEDGKFDSVEGYWVINHIDNIRQYGYSYTIMEGSLL
jgi:hypothetical protein